MARTGPLLYGIIFFGFAISNMMSYLITQFGMAGISWVGLFWVCFGLSVFAFVINFLFDEKYDF
jgi:hypothetical protein